MKTNIFSRLLFFILFAVIAQGCTSTSFEGIGRTTATSGFECPVPEFQMSILSKELNLLARADSIPTDMIECFELVYGVKVDLYEFNSDEEMYIRLSNEGVNYDVLQPSASIMPLLVRGQQLQDLDLTKLPVFKNFDPNYLDLTFDPDNKYTLPFKSGSYVIVHNTETIAEEITSWEDLWNDDYTQRMIMPDNGRVVIGMGLLTLGYDVNTLNEEQLQSARDKLWALVPSIQIFDGDTPYISLLSGKVDLGIIQSIYVPDLQAENPAFQFTYPSEGAVLWQDNWAIPAESRHIDAVYAWLNYTAQGNVSWLTLRDAPTTNPNLAALAYAKEHQSKYYETYMRSVITNIPSEVWLKGHFILDTGETTTLYNNIWVEIKGE